MPKRKQPIQEQQSQSQNQKQKQKQESKCPYCEDYKQAMRELMFSRNRLATIHPTTWNKEENENNMEARWTPEAKKWAKMCGIILEIFDPKLFL